MSLGSFPILERTRRIQPVFQDPYSSLNPRKRVASLISLPLRAHRIGTSQEQRRQVEEMAELVGLPRRALDSPPNELSGGQRSEEHTSELQSLMRISYAVFCLKKKKHKHRKIQYETQQ